MTTDDLMITSLRERWGALCEVVPIRHTDEVWHLLDEGYGDPTRGYHNWQHVASCLAWFDDFRALASAPVVVELAIWFHDIVYDSKRRDNETRSAKVASQCLEDASLALSVQRLIEATTHSETAQQGDAAMLCDIDLSILGACESDYDRYAQGVRSEYDWVPEADYRKGRAHVLRSFLERARIYSTQEAFSRWEMKARMNLRWELDSLSL